MISMVLLVGAPVALLTWALCRVAKMEPAEKTENEKSKH